MHEFVNMNNILSSRALKYNIPSLLILLYLLYALIYAFLKEPQHSQTHVFKNAEKMAAVDPSRVDYLRSGFSYKKLVAGLVCTGFIIHLIIQ